MLRTTLQFSLQHRFAVIATLFLLLGLSLYRLQSATYDVFPEFAPPQVMVETEAPGFSSDQVETLVTQVVEQAIGGSNGVTVMRSSSIQGLSAVQVYFDLNSDIYRDRQMISERITDIAGKLPAGVNTPVMTPLSSTTDIVIGIGLTSDKLNLTELRTVADWQIKPHILSVSGVADAESYGGFIRQIQIRIRPDALIRYGLSFDEVVTAAKQATGVRGAGVIDTGKQRITLNTEAAANTMDSIAHTPLTRGTAESLSLNITLGDVADVVDGMDTPFSAASIMGKPGVLLLVTSQYGANTLEVTNRVEKALRELEPALKKQGITVQGDIIRPASFVETAVSNVNTALLLGAGLVTLVLFLFLHNWRGAIISALTIPFSLVCAAALLNLLGYTLNTMTLGGLAIAVGLVVDDAVIDVENMLRRLRENPKAKDNVSLRYRTLLNAALEVRTPMIPATFAVILVSFPIIEMPGLAGRFFAPLGFAYALATLLSLVVALTLTPALSMLLLEETRTKPPAMTQWLQGRYVALLRTINNHPAPLYFIIFIVAGVCVFGAFTLKSEFIPDLHEGHFIVHMEAGPGTSLDESIRLGDQATQALMSLPFVRKVVQQVGRTERGIDIYGTNISEFNVALKPLSGKDEAAAKEQMIETLKKLPDLEFEVNTFLTERVQEVISGYTSDAVLRVYGLNLDDLDKATTQLAELLKSTNGVTDVQVPAAPGMPELTVTLNPDALRQWGLTPVSVLDAIHTAYQGEIATQVYENNHATDVALQFSSGRLQSPDLLPELPILTPSGEYVPLKKIAAIADKSGRYMILHEGGRRVQTITFNLKNSNPQALLQQVQDSISKQDLPVDIITSIQSVAEEAVKSRHQLLVYTGLAAVAIMILLSLVMRHASQLILVAVNAPLAVMGGIIAVLLGNGELSLGATVGFITLLGITLRNSILMLSHYAHVVTQEGKKWNMETVLQASSERLLPILMTALVTGIGLLPIAWGSGEPGREIEGPMAIVILGGLFTSTLLNLCALPGLAQRYARFETDSLYEDTLELQENRN